MKKTLAWTLVFAMTFATAALPAYAAAPAATGGKAAQVVEANRKPTPPRQANRPGSGAVNPGKPGQSVTSSKPANNHASARPQQNVYRPQSSQPGPANHYYAQAPRPQPHKPAPGHSYRPGYNNSSSSWWSAGIGAVIGSFIGYGSGSGYGYGW